MSLKITFVGDIMCESKQTELCYDENNVLNYLISFDKSVVDFLKKSDFVVGNLETPIAGEKLKYSYQQYSFNTPDEFLIAIKDIGIDMCATANNHCLDRGIEGLKNTIKSLKKHKIEYTGTSENKNEKRFILKELKGLRMAFLSYTYGTNATFNKEYLKNKEQYMVNLFRAQEPILKPHKILLRIREKMRRTSKKFFPIIDYPYLKKVKKDIKLAKKQADYVFVLMHSGGQYNEFVDEYTIFLSDYLLKYGGDFVIGTHPHVVLDAYMKNDKFCAYSLGNFFCTPWVNALQKDNLPDYSIVLNVYINEINKNIEKITFTIAKSVLYENGFSKVVLVNELLKNVKTDDVVKHELNSIVEKFTGLSSKELEIIDDEYVIYKGGTLNE